MAVSERVAIWKADGCYLQAQFDKLLVDDVHQQVIIFDAKITDSPNPNGLGRHIFNQGYDLQEAFYKGRGVQTT